MTDRADRFLLGPGVLVPPHLASGVLHTLRRAQDELARDRIPMSPEMRELMAALEQRISPQDRNYGRKPRERRRSVSTAEAAARLRVSERWVRELVRLGRLSGVGDGRRWLVDEEDLEDLVHFRSEVIGSRPDGDVA